MSGPTVNGRPQEPHTTRGVQNTMTSSTSHVDSSSDGFHQLPRDSPPTSPSVIPSSGQGRSLPDTGPTSTMVESSSSSEESHTASLGSMWGDTTPRGLHEFSYVGEGTQIPRWSPDMGSPSPADRNRVMDMLDSLTVANEGFETREIGNRHPRGPLRAYPPTNNASTRTNLSIAQKITLVIAIPIIVATAITTCTHAKAVRNCQSDPPYTCFSAGTTIVASEIILLMMFLERTLLEIVVTAILVFVVAMFFDRWAG